MEKKGLSLMPFFVLILFVGLGVSLMFVYYSILDIQRELEIARVNLDEDLQERYNLISGLMVTMNNEINFQINQEGKILDLSVLYDDKGKRIYDIVKGDIEDIVKNEKGVFNKENIYKMENIEGGFLLFTQFLKDNLNVDVENFSDFKRLREVDEKIALSGGEYNEIASNFNKKISSFPNNLVAFFSGIKGVPLYNLNRGY
ncbi:Uncharacterized conserved protein [Anaerobranca californiensis DSM 14826]|jgi:hypothetical protein|uniref:Uncharacterized conserved protein n=1 Tax=Anaerobranca californiensis DSM 14826 TaxID=1120989 RepID=A0A1M6KZF8_9FIRM|nr:LemA family protein [Anaerobranca californiensis]SHJ64378.1 Uncharacterized conserved protein [Anaerobranca californiensis DSM 14826]